MTAAPIGMGALAALIAIALAFDFLNGLHDAANSIATVVSTRVMRPLTAVGWAAFFNFIAFTVFGLHVARTMGSGVVDPDLVGPSVVFGALIGAIAWNIITWMLGIPSSSSHALVGGLMGAGLAKAGSAAIVWHGIGLIGVAIVLSPLVGFMVALTLVGLVAWMSIGASPFAVDRRFRWLQIASSALLSLSHGGNDAQKTMGVITALLYSQGVLHGAFSVPMWVVLSCQAAMAGGTLIGGWRIVRTVGSRITHLRPTQGFCAEAGGACALFGATWLGVPVSTTHTVTGAVMGVGAARSISAVRWGVARGIVVAWVITLPAAAIMGAGAFWLATLWSG